VENKATSRRPIPAARARGAGRALTWAGRRGGGLRVGTRPRSFRAPRSRRDSRSGRSVRAAGKAGDPGRRRASHAAPGCGGRCPRTVGPCATVPEPETRGNDRRAAAPGAERTPQRLFPPSSSAGWVSASLCAGIFLARSDTRSSPGGSAPPPPPGYAAPPARPADCVESAAGTREAMSPPALRRPPRSGLPAGRSLSRRRPRAGAGAGRRRRLPLPGLPPVTTVLCPARPGARPAPTSARSPPARPRPSRRVPGPHLSAPSWARVGGCLHVGDPWKEAGG
jgi:hypothetical protein